MWHYNWLMFLCSGPIVIVVLGGASDGSVTRKFWEIFYWTRLFFQFHGESYSGYALWSKASFWWMHSINHVGSYSQLAIWTVSSIYSLDWTNFTTTLLTVSFCLWKIIAESPSSWCTLFMWVRYMYSVRIFMNTMMHVCISLFWHMYTLLAFGRSLPFKVRISTPCIDSYIKFVLDVTLHCVCN
jgi:hypothetical protein